MRGDVIVLSMDDELLMVESASNDAGVFLVAAGDGYSHEYPIDDIQTIYRAIDMHESVKGESK